MEQLLHYTWMHRLFPLRELRTTDGRLLEVLNPGIHNTDAGPDFTGAKIKLDGAEWAGNVELHLKTSDWFRHHHDADPAYENIILHVACEVDQPLFYPNGQPIPQLQLPVPAFVHDNFDTLSRSDVRPRCRGVVGDLPLFLVHNWMTTLTLQRFEERARQIMQRRESLDKDWEGIRGAKISTIFQDPMTSLNPIRTIGSQITEVIEKHQGVSKAEAKKQAIEIMERVGIKDAANRFDEFPFQYSGGMRQRIVIAIALSCHPEILICDEPTTALDVTIQAQILQLIRDLQKELGFTTLYITHDLGVVANVADRVGVMYGGQIIEYGTVEEIFFEPCHPYTWALLSSLPQLGVKGQDLYYITGTPPSLYNKIKGDAFAPRNEHALKIDFVQEPPFFKVSDTHYAKTWLLDPRAPKLEKPEVIQNLHEKIKKMTDKGGAFHVE